VKCVVSLFTVNYFLLLLWTFFGGLQRQKASLYSLFSFMITIILLRAKWRIGQKQDPSISCGLCELSTVIGGMEVSSVTFYLTKRLKWSNKLWCYIFTLHSLIIVYARSLYWKNHLGCFYRREIYF